MKWVRKKKCGLKVIYLVIAKVWGLAWFRRYILKKVQRSVIFAFTNQNNNETVWIYIYKTESLLLIRMLRSKRADI